MLRLCIYIKLRGLFIGRIILSIRISWNELQVKNHEEVDFQMNNLGCSFHKLKMQTVLTLNDIINTIINICNHRNNTLNPNKLV